MATQILRIGSIAGISYDDGDFDSAVETDQPIKAGTPVDATDVIRLEDLAGRLLSPVSVVAIANPTELNSVAGVLGALVLVYQIVGATGLNEYTLYAYDASGPAVNAPYIMDADGAGDERWIAVAGKYAVQNYDIDGVFLVSGTQVVGPQAVAEANIASGAITDPVDAPADADALRDDLVANAIAEIGANFTALDTKINNILAKLRTHGLFDT